MGKIDTTTILLLGAGALAIYFFTRPTTPVYPPGYNPYAAGGYSPYQQPNQLPGLIQAGGSAAGSLISSLFGPAPLAKTNQPASTGNQFLL